MRPIALAVEPDDVEDLLDLRQWLSENDGLTHNVSRVPEARPEHMGAEQTLALVLLRALPSNWFVLCANGYGHADDSLLSGSRTSPAKCRSQPRTSAKTVRSSALSAG